MTNSNIPNQLVNEKSPYLQQHAHNPVNWYPWCEEAFAKAKAEDKPIMLSSGYSTCHWCHVMAHESFENDEVANTLNANFVAIKVDREERPEIDSIYMTFCQAMTGSGGWPLTVFMTADQKPFYAGTYFPLQSRYNYPGFIDLLSKISTLWQTERKALLARSDELIARIKAMTPSRKETSLPEQVFKTAVNELEQSFDTKFGGFNNAPKFPMPHILSFLINYYLVSQEGRIKDILSKTLLQMYRGGIYDHIGGGWSRYSTDRQWLVPHFEKMLYDNALLIPVYINMGSIMQEKLFYNIASDTIEYLLRDMSAPGGAFYTAEDADSEGEEGLFYVWTLAQLKEFLDEKEHATFTQYFNITEQGNFEGKNIPNLINTTTLVEPESEKAQYLNKIKLKIRREREKRIRPHRDEKILSGWNGLTIAALARAGRVLGRRDYFSIADKCFQFIKSNLMREDGRLLGSYCDGQIGSMAILDDYAYLTYGLLELFQATGQATYLTNARHLIENMFLLFGDDAEGGFYLYGSDSEQLVLRPKEAYDGALPSGNAIAVHNLLTIGRIKREPYYRDNAKKTINTFANDIALNPTSYAAWVNAALLLGQSPIDVVITGLSPADTAELEQVVDRNYFPFITVIRNYGDMELTRELPFLNEYTVGATPTAFVCTDKQCFEPITKPEELFRVLKL